MSKNEKTSKRVASKAARLLTAPEKATKADIRTLAASALTQARDKPKASKKR